MRILDVPKSIIDLLTMAEAGDAWGAPEAVKATLKPVPVFNPAMLPDAIRPWVVDISHRMQAPIDFAAAGAVTMIGSIIGSACGIRPKQKDDWTEVPNLWGAAIGDPGRMKTPAVSQAMAPLHTLDYEARMDHEAAMAAYEYQRLTNKMQAELLKKSLAKAGTPPTPADIAQLATLSIDKDDAPKCRRYFTNDTTFEMLGEILRDSPRGALVLHDELMGLLEGFERPGREGERQFYLTAWNGKHAHRVDRIGRGELYIPRLSASLFGGIQPQKLEEYVYKTQLAGGNDGFVQRFQLAVYPDEKPLLNVIDERPDEAAFDKVVTICRRLAHFDFAAAGADQDGEGQLPYFRFAVRAQPVFNAFLVSLDKKQRDEESPVMTQHLTKFKKLVPALALIFHLLDLAATPVPVRLPKPKAKAKPASRVSLGNLRLALQWAEYLEAHAQRIYSMGSDYSVQSARALGTKIENGAVVDGFSERDVYINQWAALRNADEVRAACNELELAGWIRRKANDSKRPGRPSVKYEINPAVMAGANATPSPPKPSKPRRKTTS